jgi:hypothetical protein
LHFFSLHKHSSYKLKNNLQIFFNNFNWEGKKEGG